MTKQQAQKIYEEWAKQSLEKQEGFVELLVRLGVLKLEEKA